MALHQPNNLVQVVDLPQKTSSIFAEVVLFAGYRFAPTAKREASHLLEHYLCQTVRDAGISCSGSTDIQTIRFQIKVRRQSQLEQCLALLLDNSVNDETIFNKQQSIMRTELAGTLDDPGRFSHRVIQNAQFVGDPILGLHVPNRDTIALSDIAKLYRQKQPGPLIVIGTSRPGRSFQKWVRDIGQRYARPEVSVPLQELAKWGGEMKYRWGLGQSYLNMVWPAATSFAPPREQIALMLLLDLLVTRDDAILYRVLHDEAGLLYDLDGAYDSHPSYGYFALSASVLPENAQRVRQAILDEIDRLQNKLIDERQLRSAIKDYLAALRRQWADNVGRLSWIATDLLERRRIFSRREWSKECQSIDSRLMARVAKKYLRPDSVSTICIEK